MKKIKNPGPGGNGARKRFEGHLKNITLPCQSQPISPASWLIRSNFIESLVSKPFSTERSLKVDFLLILADFFEQGSDHVCN